jgi:PPOX class probable F420-dependent enzyme
MASRPPTSGTSRRRSLDLLEIPPEAREVLESDALAHLVTLNPDGSPQVTCVWVGLEGDEIVSAHLARQQKLRNVERDARVTISLETDRTNPIGLREYLVIHGLARIEEGGAPELLQQLAYTYIGEGVKFPPMPDPPPGFIVHTTVERVGGVGPWAR